MAGSASPSQERRLAPCHLRVRLAVVSGAAFTAAASPDITRPCHMSSASQIQTTSTGASRTQLSVSRATLLSLAGSPAHAPAPRLRMELSSTFFLGFLRAPFRALGRAETQQPGVAVGCALAWWSQQGAGLPSLGERSWEEPGSGSHRVPPPYSSPIYSHTAALPQPYNPLLAPRRAPKAPCSPPPAK